MARTGRPVTKLALTDQERAELMMRLAIRKASDEDLRTRVVLGCADGESGTHIARRLKTSIQTVPKWRHRYDEAYRFAGLADAMRRARADRVRSSMIKCRRLD